MTYSAQYAAYLLEHGYPTREAAHEASERSHGHRNLEFMEWTEARWAEFERVNGIKPGTARRYHLGAFQAWLRDRSADHLARAHVEARAA